MRRVLLDTIGFLALWNRRDQWHEPAAQVFRGLAGEGTEFWTTTHILLECGNAAARTPFRRDVVEVRQHLLAAGKLVEPTESDCATAWLAYSQGQAGEAGIVDQVSFAVMRRLGLVEAFTNDKHFRSAGFITLF